MSDTDITIKIKYDVIKDKFDVETNAKNPHELVSDWIRSQIGKGADSSQSIQSDIYNITLTVDLSQDVFTVNHDCGNKGLRDGILMHYMRTDEDD